MNIHHHLDHATLVRFAGGELDAAFDLVVATHIAMCPDCREALRVAESVGGALLEDQEPVALDAGALDAVLASLDDLEVVPAPAGAVAPGDSEVPLPLRRLIGDRLDSIRWRPVAPGVGKYVLPMDKSSRGSAFMLKIAPGMAMPEHGHGGDEITLILQGSYRDEIGQFGVGDVADLDDHIEHTPTVNSDVACVCLVATERPTRFKTLLGKIMQPIARI